MNPPGGGFATAWQDWQIGPSPGTALNVLAARTTRPQYVT
jgi:hypothetical protein